MLEKPRNSGISAPQIDSGTVTRITSGSRKLSNCAASTRKISARARPKVAYRALPSWMNWRAAPA
ncbi:hypothetical protein FQZ97_1033630 [compost metagenome]